MRPALALSARICPIFVKVLRAIRFAATFTVPATYEDEYEKARLTFRHMRCYNPKTEVRSEVEVSVVFHSSNLCSANNRICHTWALAGSGALAPATS